MSACARPLLFLLIAAGVVWTARGADTNRIVVAWDSVSGATGYVVRCGPNPRTFPLMTYYTNGLSLSVSNMTARPWHFSVWALNNQGRATLISNEVNSIVGTTTNRVSLTNSLSGRMGSNVTSFVVWPTNQTLRFK